MTSVLVDFDYFKIIFVNCDEVYKYIEDYGGRSEYILDNVAEILRKSTAYIKLSENHKRFSRFYGSNFNIFDIMDGIYSFYAGEHGMLCKFRFEVYNSKCCLPIVRMENIRNVAALNHKFNYSL